MRFQPPSQSFALVAGVLPPGMILDPATGIVFGTPIGAGRYTSTIQVSPIDSQPFTDTFTITVDDPHHAVNYPARVEAALGSPVVVNPHLQSEIGDVTFTVECGQLPSGLRLNKKTGVITGTPANDYVQGSIPLRIKVDDQNGTVHASFIIEVAEQSGVPLTYPSHPHLTVDKKVSIGASGSFPPGVTFAIPGLPKGLKLNKTTGEITGVPTTLITKPKLVTAELSDANGNLLDSETISITVRKAPVPLTVSGRKASVPVKAGTSGARRTRWIYLAGDGDSKSRRYRLDQRLEGAVMLRLLQEENHLLTFVFLAVQAVFVLVSAVFGIHFWTSNSRGYTAVIKAGRAKRLARNASNSKSFSNSVDPHDYIRHHGGSPRVRHRHVLADASARPVWGVLRVSELGPDLARHIRPGLVHPWRVVPRRNSVPGPFLDQEDQDRERRTRLNHQPVANQPRRRSITTICRSR
jgi:hypothetical protein